MDTIETLKELRSARERAQSIVDTLMGRYDDCAKSDMTALHDALESANNAVYRIDILIGEYLLTTTQQANPDFTDGRTVKEHVAFLRDEECPS